MTVFGRFLDPSNDILRQKWHFCHFGAQKWHLPMESSVGNELSHRDLKSTHMMKFTDFSRGRLEGRFQIPPKMPFLSLLKGRFQVLGPQTRYLRKKIMKKHKNDENGQNVTFWGCRRNLQKRHFFSSRKPKWVCVKIGVTPREGGFRGGPKWDPLFGHFWGSKMTPF